MAAYHQFHTGCVVVDQVLTGIRTVRQWPRRCGVYTAQVKRRLEDRFKAPDDPFRIVIVRDMWLTGFDAPSLSTMYVDKPRKGHTI